HSSKQASASRHESGATHVPSIEHPCEDEHPSQAAPPSAGQTNATSTVEGGGSPSIVHSIAPLASSQPQRRPLVQLSMTTSPPTQRRTALPSASQQPSALTSSQAGSPSPSPSPSP